MSPEKWDITHRTKGEEEAEGGDTVKYWDRPTAWLELERERQKFS